MDYTQEKYYPVLIKLASDIDNMDYYQILNLPSSCNKAQIKKQYYDMSRALHPDKFYQLEIDGKEIPNIKDSINKVDQIIRYLFIKVKDHSELPTKLMNIEN